MSAEIYMTVVIVAAVNVDVGTAFHATAVVRAKGTESEDYFCVALLRCERLECFTDWYYFWLHNSAAMASS